MRKKWEEEPDRVEFVHKGFKCLVLRHSTLKHLRGYVALPKEHPYYGCHYDNLNVDVHGGLTFGKKGDGKDWEPNYWWIGFDCAHAGDYTPGIEEMLTTAGFKKGPKGIKGVFRETYKSIDYVKKEVRKLARQLTIPKIAERKFDGE